MTRNFFLITTRLAILAGFFLLLSFGLLSCSGPVSRRCDTVVVRTPAATVRLQVVSSDIVHVSAVPFGALPTRPSLVVLPRKSAFQDFEVGETLDGNVLVRTDSLRAVVDKSTGVVSFLTSDGKPLALGRSYDFVPTKVEGKDAYSVTTVFESPEDESFYGLGQQQTGEFDHKGLNEELYQYNTKISIPFVVSSKGYGLLFDAYSLSRWGNPEGYLQLGDVLKLYDKDGAEGALTGTYVAKDGKVVVRREESLFYENEREIGRLPEMDLSGSKVCYEGFIEAPVDGKYYFTQYYAGFQRTEVDGKEVMPRLWRPAWNPNSYRYCVDLVAGCRVPVLVEWEPDGGVSYLGVRVARPRSSEEQSRLSFYSEFEPGVDYYFIKGDTYDKVISGYRLLTGKASVFPKWSLGFWQSRERYSSQDQLVGTLAKMRELGIPVDNIVQDWQYWKEDQWGSHEFDPERYSDPEKMLEDVHKLHGRFMISVWPKFYTNTDHYKELKAAGYVYTHAEDTAIVDWTGHKQSFYDAYSPGGRKMFWDQIDETLYSRYGRKIDAWWMDASEPNLRDCLPFDYLKWLLTPTALGPSTEYFNAYSLVNADAIYNGQRGVEPDKRVFLLTRNGFSGLQRYSTASWSGDIGTSWEDMRAQMAAGLGYSMAGLPMWGMDIGGFSVMGRFGSAVSLYRSTGKVTPDLEEWRELQTRWHQFGAFVPLFRTHGQWPERELWNIDEPGSATFGSVLWYMKLRYRLMPYLYSLAGWVHFDDYTFMRGLPMDFPSDPAVKNLSDQWMLGPALMPCPVYVYKARERRVHFPTGSLWYDFYTGATYQGGTDDIATAPYERMPLFVRAGSIIPFGPDMQYSDEKLPETIELYVYTGSDGRFKLYEDSGVDYGYERGEFSTIPITWDEDSGTLTIGRREGSYPSMLDKRMFNVVKISPDASRGYSTDSVVGALQVLYEGEPVSVKL